MKKKNNNFTLGIIMLMSFVFLVGCQGMYSDQEYAMAMPICDRCDIPQILLMPSVDQDGEILNGTTYEMYLHGSPLGTYPADKYVPVNVTTDINSTFMTSYGDEYEAIVRVDLNETDRYAYTSEMGFDVDCAEVQRVVPEIFIGELPEIKQIKGYYGDLVIINNTVYMRDYDETEVEVIVDFNGNVRFDSIVCDYERDVAIEINNNAESFSIYEGVGWEYIEDEVFITIYSKDMYDKPSNWSTSIRCELADVESYVDHLKGRRYGVYDDKGNDIGMANPKFEIIVKSMEARE